MANVSATIDMTELTQLARGYFSDTLPLDCIEKAVSVDYARALYGVLKAARERAYAAGKKALVQKIYKIQYRVLPSWFHYERNQNARNNQKPAPVVQEPKQAEQPAQLVKPPTKGGFERIHRDFMDACRKGQQQRAGGFKGVIHNHYPQHEYVADQALAHYFPKK